MSLKLLLLKFTVKTTIQCEVTVQKQSRMCSVFNQESLTQGWPSRAEGNINGGCKCARWVRLISDVMLRMFLEKQCEASVHDGGRSFVPCESPIVTKVTVIVIDCIALSREGVIRSRSGSSIAYQ